MKLVLKIETDEEKAMVKNIGKALSSLQRIDILELIGKNEDFNYGDISEAIGRSPTAVTNHMKWIQNSGLIRIKMAKGKRGRLQKIPKIEVDEIVIKLV